MSRLIPKGVVGHALVLNFYLQSFGSEEDTHHCKRRGYFPVTVMDPVLRIDYSSPPVADIAAAEVVVVVVVVVIEIAGIAVVGYAVEVVVGTAVDMFVEDFDIDSDCTVERAVAAASWRDESVGAVVVNGVAAVDVGNDYDAVAAVVA